MQDAIAKKDFNGIEQNKNTLKQFAEEGLAKLKENSNFDGDRSLVAACSQLLQFYRTESDKVNQITDFFLKEENFNKVKNAIESKRESERTQKDVDEYNKAVNDFNNQVKAYNALNDQLYNSRSKLIENWNNSSQEFLNKHIPR